MEQAFDVLFKVLMTTYTIALPIILARLVESRKEKKAAHQFVMDSVAAINNTVKELGEKIDLQEAMTSRYRIIRAADEIRNGGRPSDDAIGQLSSDLDVYDSYVERHPLFKNHKGQNSRRLILEWEKELMKGET